MFNSNKSMSKNAPADGNSINLIGAGTSIEGDIQATSDIRIDGTLKGTINTKGKLVVGPSGNIEGEINCQQADISGNVQGKIFVHELLAIKATGKVNGDTTYGKIMIEPGADFTGTCRIVNVVKDIKHAAKAAEPRLEEKTA